MSELKFESASKLLTPIECYATLEVIDSGIVFPRVEYYPGIEPHFRITTANREHIWISAVAEKQRVNPAVPGTEPTD